MATQQPEDILLSQLPQLEPQQLEALGFSEEVQHSIQTTHQEILEAIRSGSDVSETTKAFLDRFRVGENISLHQQQWLQERFGRLLGLSAVRQAVETLEEDIANLPAEERSKLKALLAAGKLPLWLVKKTSKLGSCGCLAVLLVALGAMAYALFDIIAAAGYMVDANLRAGEEIKKKEQPLEDAIAAMESARAAQAESLRRQAELGQQLERVRRNFSLMTAVDSLEDRFETQLYMHTLNRSLPGLGESALRARDAQGDTPEVMMRINVYTQAVFLFVRTQLQSQIEELETQENTSRWGRVNAAGALEGTTPEEQTQAATRTARLQQLRVARDFMDQFLVLFGDTRVVRPAGGNPPVARDYAGWNSEAKQAERQRLMRVLDGIDFSNLGVDTEGLIHSSGNLQTTLRAVLHNDAYVDVRLLNAFVDSVRTQTGVMYRVNEEFQSDRRDFLELKRSLGVLSNAVPQAVQPEVLAEVERIITARRTEIMAAQGAARQRMIQNLEDTRELRAQFEAVKERYHLDDPFVRAALRVCRWMVGNPLEGFEKGGKYRRDSSQQGAQPRKSITGPQRRGSERPHRRQNR